MKLLNKIEVAEAYKFFANCFYYPDDNQLAYFEKHEFKTNPNFKNLFSALEEAEIENLRVEFSKLFVGPFKVLAPPYGSVYLDENSTINGESTVHVANMYKEENLKVELKEPVDHVAIEFEFMYYLILKELEALEHQDNDTSTQYLNKQKELMNRHLAIWVPKFTQNILTHASLTFYKQLGQLLTDFLKEEYKRLN